MNTIPFASLDPFQKEKVKEKDKKPKKYKDDAGHNLYIQVSGDFESIIVYCLTCGLAYQFTKQEVEELEDA